MRTLTRATVCGNDTRPNLKLSLPHRTMICWETLHDEGTAGQWVLCSGGPDQPTTRGSKCVRRANAPRRTADSRTSNPQPAPHCGPASGRTTNNEFMPDGCPDGCAMQRATGTMMMRCASGCETRPFFGGQTTPPATAPNTCVLLNPNMPSPDKSEGCMSARQTTTFLDAAINDNSDEWECASARRHNCHNLNTSAAPANGRHQHERAKSASKGAPKNAYATHLPHPHAAADGSTDNQWENDVRTPVSNRNQILRSGTHADPNNTTPSCYVCFASARRSLIDGSPPPHTHQTIAADCGRADARSVTDDAREPIR